MSQPLSCVSAANLSYEWPVALVSMPFVSICHPSIQLGLLSSILSSHGFRVTPMHLALDFAHQIGTRDYELLAEHRGHLFGEWLFGVEAFGAQRPYCSDALIDHFGPTIDRTLQCLGDYNPRERLQVLRDVEAPKFLDTLMENIDWEAFRVVGFTSTFQQNTASFALAARIKLRFPHIALVFGGSNFDDPMGKELVQSIDCIDYAIRGEADVSFPAFLTALREGREPDTIEGIMSKGSGAGKGSAPLPTPRMDALPTPNYDDFFNRAESLGLLNTEGRRIVEIPFESARGCWWGAKHHCTFCGLNGDSMTFRSKSAERLREELAELTRRYRSFQLTAVDNIMDQQYLNGLLPLLIEDKSDYDLFYEIKANLRRHQLKLLRDAGIRRIQPGIESLSTHVLQLMRKGTRAIQNVNLLRWALYYDISVAWNLLWGFPNEVLEDYDEQLVLMKWIIHLQPPLGGSRIWMERFSPIFNERTQFPTRYVRPEASYAYIYPQHIDLDKVAYFFDYEFDNSLPEETYADIKNQISTWQSAWQQLEKPTLSFWSAPGFLQIEDNRYPDVCGTYTFEGNLAELYCACSDRPRTTSSLCETLAFNWREESVNYALQSFCERGLMMRDGNQYLSLALPALKGR